MKTAKIFVAIILVLVGILTSLLIVRVATAEPDDQGYFWIVKSNCNQAEARWDHDDTYEIWTTPTIYSECWDDDDVKWMFSRPMPRYRTEWDAGGQIWHEYFRTPDYAPFLHMECYDINASMQIRRVSDGTLFTKVSNNANVFNWSCKYDSLPLIINGGGNQQEMLAYPAPQQQSIILKEKKPKGNPYP